KLVLARLAPRQSCVYTEETKQRLELGGESMAAHRDRYGAALGRHRAVRIDNAREKRQEMLFRVTLYPLRDMQSSALPADLVIDERGRATRLEAGDRIVPDRRAVRRHRCDTLRLRTTKCLEERGIASDNVSFRGANLEDEPLAERARTCRPGSSRGLVIHPFRIGAPITQMCPGEPRVHCTFPFGRPWKLVMHEGIVTTDVIGTRVDELARPIDQYRMLARCPQPCAVRYDLDVLVPRHVRRQVTQDRSHFEPPGIAVVTQDARVPFDDGTLRGHQAPVRVDGSIRRNAAGLERQPRLVDLLQDVVHRVVDGPGHGAVDGGGCGLVLLRAGVRDDAA